MAFPRFDTGNFTYFLVVQAYGFSAVGKKPDPDAQDSESEFEVKLSVPRHHIIDSAATELWL